MKRLAIWMGLIIFFAVSLPVFGQQTAEEYYNKGIELYEAQNYNEAATAFEKAIEIKPDYADAYYNLGQTYWQQKQYQKVLEKLQKVVELAPGSDTAKKAEQDIKKLKNAGISLVIIPKEEEAKEGDGEESSPTTEPSEKPKATLPELIEDLQFGPPSKKIAAANWLKFYPGEEAVKALGEVTGKSAELPEIRTTAVESLGKIALPSAIPFLQTALEAPDFPNEGKPTAIKALSTINTTESLKVILSVWNQAFFGGISNQNVVELVRKKGREDFADIIRPAYLQATGGNQTSFASPLGGIPRQPGLPSSLASPTGGIPGQPGLPLYMALALGILKDATGVPLMVNRLKEDYPSDAPPRSSLNQPFSNTAPGLPGVPRGAALPPAGMPGLIGRPAITPILKQNADSGSWSRKDEAGLRVDITEVLGICAGANQKPFLIYLSKNDQEKKVRETALKAIEQLDLRVASSTETYQKGATLAKEGKITEAIPILQVALKQNPDAPYAEEIKKLQARFTYDQALVLLKANKNEEAVALLQSALELDPNAPFRKDIEDKLAKLQMPAQGLAGGMPPGLLIPGALLRR